MRIAVTTGEALVALDARTSEGEGMVAGDVVNTAARLQSAAPVNGILVDESDAARNAPARSTTASVEPVEREGEDGAGPRVGGASRRARASASTSPRKALLSSGGSASSISSPTL